MTFQARDLSESRQLYDGLAVIAPLVLALTANAPIWRGRLAATDTRWDVISASVDCRTPAERGHVEVGAGVEGAEPPPPWLSHPFASRTAGGGARRLYKSRYSSVDAFISDGPSMRDEYNDVPLPVDPDAKAALVAGGVDARLASHIAALFVRDPLVIFAGRIDGVDDEGSSEHFENVQSTNWRSVRWKPPPPIATTAAHGAAAASAPGWRVELRTMEVQLTDFENAAFTVFVVLLTRVMLTFDLNLYIPMSAVDDNFTRASGIDAVTRSRFHFRRHVLPPQAGAPAAPAIVDEMSLAEILLGPGAGSTSTSTSTSSDAPAFPGLIPLICVYLDLIKCDDETRAVVDQ